jgi:hypothetical protein
MATPRTSTPNEVIAAVDRLSIDIGTLATTRLRQIVALLSPQSHTTTSGEVLKAVYADGKSLDSRNKSFALLRDQFNEAAERANLAIRLEIDAERKRGAERTLRFVRGVAPVPTQTADELHAVQSRGELIDDTPARLLDQEPPIRLGTTIDGMQNVRIVVAASNADDSVTDLIRLLRTTLASVRQYRVTVWSTREVLSGENVTLQEHQAYEQAHLIIAACSPSMVADELERLIECRHVRVDPNDHPFGCRVIRVDVAPVAASANLRGLPDAPSNAQLRTHFPRTTGQRQTWIKQLADDIVALLDKHGQPLEPAKDAVQVASRNIERFRYRHSTDDLDRIPYIMESRGARHSLAHEHHAITRLSGASDATASELLTEWLNASGPPLFALLGEYGMGKTITCQRLLRDVETKRENGEPLPRPLYFDLRKLAGLRSRAVPTLEEIVNEVIQRGWGLHGDRPTFGELTARNREEPFLWIFDGLDEALVHFDKADGQQFTRELLRLRPSSANQLHQATRLLISCRTHFFRTIDEQRSHFADQERDATRADDYRGMVLLPFGEEQITAYLHAVRGDDDAARAVSLLESVHDLREVASRPIMLRWVTELIPELETARARGTRISAVSLYDQMVNRWIARDDGKHHISKPEHKRRLLMHLAAWLWKRGERLVPVGELESWFHAWLDEDTELHRRYAHVGPDQLEEDLRTASLLVREDGRSAAESGFRFAHSSIHEYLLACYLVDAVARSERYRWAIPLVSPETRAFVGELFAEPRNQALVASLARWNRPYLADASEQWLRYVLDAKAQGWLAPSAEGCDMCEANLHGWEFVGRSSSQPLVMNGARFRDAELRETTWRDVLLHDVDLSRARLDRAELWRVAAHRINLEASSVNGTTFRRFDWTGGSWLDSRGEGKRFLACAAPASALSPSSVLGQHDSIEWSTRFGRAASAQIAVTPDGTQVVSRGNDGTVRVWSRATGECVGTWRGHEGRVSSVAVTPDGTQVLSVSSDGSLRQWAVGSGQNTRIHQIADGGYAVWDTVDQRLLDVSPDSWRWLVARVRDSEGRVLGNLPAEHVTQMPQWADQ